MGMEAVSASHILALVLIFLSMHGVFTQDSACDGWYGTGVTVSESVKVIITSPNFPLDYDNDKKCIWRVSTSDAGLIIKATFNEFDLQYNTGSGDCPFDSLTFSDGDSSGGDVIGKYCDTIYPEVIYSTENGMYIEFQSDSFSTYKGFEITVSAVKAEEGLGLCNPSKGQIRKPYGSSGTLYTPQFPIPYPDDTTCIWTITAPVGKRVKLMFEKFSLPQTPYFLEEPHADGEYCGYDESMGADLVEIRDGPWPDSRLLGIYCGYKIPFDVFSTGRYLWVKFRSISDGKTSRGIKAPFEAVDPIVSEEQCLPGNSKNVNLKLTGLEGTLQSPLKYYPLNMNCDWLITVPDDSFVKLSFERFDLGSGSCNGEDLRDYVEVLDGKELDSESKGKFCDRTIPPIIRSSGRHMRVVFRSDGSGPFYTGFKAAFTAVEKKNNTVQLHLTIAVVVLSVILLMVVACLLVQRLKRKKKPRNEAARGTVHMSTVARSDSATELAGVTEHSPPSTPRVPVAPSANSPRPRPVGYTPVPTALNLPPSEGPNLVDLPPAYPTEEQIPQYPSSGESYPWQQTQASAARESTF